MAYDLYPVESMNSRTRFYSRAIPEHWLVMFTHDPELPWTYLKKDDRGKVVTED